MSRKFVAALFAAFVVVGAGSTAQAQTPAQASTPGRRKPDVSVVSGRAAAPDYSRFEAPAASRHRQQRAVGDGLRPDLPDEDVLDIPAFLRRQAD